MVIEAKKAKKNAKIEAYLKHGWVLASTNSKIFLFCVQIHLWKEQAGNSNKMISVKADLLLSNYFSANQKFSF